ncbi:Rho GTPase activating protein with PAK-box/P21-Rho-binding domain-containing protein [Perilla frutescens var. hirtella]|uniref:Rho GTPase activating protein with PAK-box/P21-Rho-binding domain-containing protein n=1 Tax=Perilla frutescens var. hirtella TaxID=608512 RepID=A0AAD4JB84_PERFH|nr:Rho GTPase activating protein with PAK-box/P21-Rho-binding domain-containing protein [Perilla frutescens var. hirtella]
MTEILLRSPPQQLPSTSTSSTSISNVVELSKQNQSDNYGGSGELIGEEAGDDQLPVLAVLLTVFRKSLVSCRSRVSGVSVHQEQIMEIGCPTNVRHVAHVTFDRFNGFLGLPVEFEPEVPRRPPSASTRVFGVSTESMQLSFDFRGNCVPTILLMMQRRLYSQRGLESEGIFRINPENGQEEYVREQLNNGLIPDDIDVHCLAGLIKAWFRELPKGILDSLEPEQVMQAQSEEECSHLVTLLPPTEAALLDWAINLMADVAQFEHLNKMNARNIAMVFAPNMTQMSDPLTALMYAVQVMNFLKTLIVKTMRQRQDSVIESSPMINEVPSDDHDRHHTMLKPISMKNNNINTAHDESCGICEEGEANYKEAKNGGGNLGFLSSIENFLPKGKGHANVGENRFADILSAGGSMRSILEAGGDSSLGSGRNHSRSRPRTSNQAKKHTPHSEIYHFGEAAVRNKEISAIRRVNSCTERRVAWR